MKTIKIELARTQDPKFYCPFSGYNLLDEGLEKAVDAGHLSLAVNWESPDEFVLGEEKIMVKYMAFESIQDEDPDERVARFLKSEGYTDSCFIIELTVNAMGCGPISDTNTYVFIEKEK